MADRYNPEKHNRRSIRLHRYDYSRQGAYFVTICTQNRECLFGNIHHNEMVLNHAGTMICQTWNDVPIKCPGIVIDQYTVMPNHAHAIICIVGTPLVGALSLESRMSGTDGAGTGSNRRAGTRPAPTSLGQVVGMFKSISTHTYVINIHANDWPPFAGKLWQRNYYEHIIRNEDELNRIREYIKNNPLQWVNDRNNPVNFNNVK